VPVNEGAHEADGRGENESAVSMHKEERRSPDVVEGVDGFGWVL
jgi:hypothetical protein